MKRASVLRRVELVEQMRRSAPLDYDYTARNREQRRRLARELSRRAAKKTGA